MNLIFQKDIFLIWILKLDIHPMNLRILIQYVEFAK